MCFPDCKNNQGKLVKNKKESQCVVPFLSHYWTRLLSRSYIKRIRRNWCIFRVSLSHSGNSCAGHQDIVRLLACLSLALAETMVVFFLLYLLYRQPGWLHVNCSSPATSLTSSAVRRWSARASRINSFFLLLGNLPVAKCPKCSTVFSSTITAWQLKRLGSISMKLLFPDSNCGWPFTSVCLGAASVSPCRQFSMQRRKVQHLGFSPKQSLSEWGLTFLFPSLHFHFCTDGFYFQFPSFPSCLETWWWPVKGRNTYCHLK